MHISAWHKKTWMLCNEKEMVWYFQNLIVRQIGRIKKSFELICKGENYNMNSWLRSMYTFVINILHG